MRINPVMYSEIRMRMRGVKTVVLMSVYFVILLVVFALLYRVMDNDYSYYDLVRPRPEGMDLLIPMFAVLLFMVYGVIVLMVPALNAGNIASEREKQTLDLLIISRMSAFKIVIGKIMSNLLFVVFLLVLALPLFAVMYLFGSIMFFDIIKAFFYMAISTYACASLATFFSALVKKTSIATMLTYITLILFVIVTLVVGFVLVEMRYYRDDYSYDETYIPVVLKINPVFTLIEIVSDAEGNADTGSGIMEDLIGGEYFGFIIWSSGFMLILSPLMNVASAIFIKPVKKLKLRS